MKGDIDARSNRNPGLIVPNPIVKKGYRMNRITRRVERTRARISDREEKRLKTEKQIKETLNQPVGGWSKRYQR